MIFVTTANGLPCTAGFKDRSLDSGLLAGRRVHVSMRSSHVTDAPPHRFFTPEIMLTLVLFLVFSALFFTFYFYGQEICSYILRRVRKQRKPEPEPDIGAGFGYDGLPEAEIKELGREEEPCASVSTKTSWFIRLPNKPPLLVLGHSSPLPPIHLPSDATNMQLQGIEKIPEGSDKVLEEESTIDK